MIRKNQKLINRFNSLSDGIILLFSYLFASWLWLDVIKNTTNNMAALENLQGSTMVAGAVYALWTLIMLAFFGMYSTTRIHQPQHSAGNILMANAVALASGAAALFLFRLVEFSRGVLGVYFVTSSFLLIAKRLLLRALLRYYRKKGYNLKHMLVVGTGELAGRYIESVNNNKALGIHIAKQLEVNDCLPSIMEELLHESAIDEVILALDPAELGFTTRVIEICEKCGTRVSVIPFYNDVIPTKPTIDIVGPIKLIRLRTTPLDNPLNGAVKRGFDIIISALLLLLLSPLFALLALTVKLESPGPVFFSQQRVGYKKKLFMMYKFRSMKMNSEQDSAWSKAGDTRRTRLGSLMRKTSLDELPQLFNVLKGDMSLVGPRPEIPFFVEQFRETVPLYMVKNQVRPGMTGWAQVHGLRGDTSIPDRIKHDLWYIENWSFGLDLLILFRTAFGGMINQEKIGHSSGKGEAAS